jgi:hypothetical protein
MNRAIQCLLKLGPLIIVKDKPLSIGKRLVGCCYAGIEQKFANIFMAGTGGLL